MAVAVSILIGMSSRMRRTDWTGRTERQRGARRRGRGRRRGRVRPRGRSRTSPPAFRVPASPHFPHFPSTQPSVHPSNQQKKKRRQAVSYNTSNPSPRPSIHSQHSPRPPCSSRTPPHVPVPVLHLHPLLRFQCTRAQTHPSRPAPRHTHTAPSCAAASRAGCAPSDGPYLCPPFVIRHSSCLSCPSCAPTPRRTKGAYPVKVKERVKSS